MLQPIGSRHTWLFDTLGLNGVFNNLQSYNDGKFTFTCVSQLAHTSYSHNILSKKLAAFPHTIGPLVKDKWRLLRWLLSNIGNNVCQSWFDQSLIFNIGFQNSSVVHVINMQATLNCPSRSINAPCCNMVRQTDIIWSENKPIQVFLIALKCIA